MNNATEVSQIEQVVRFHRGREEVRHRFLVDVHCRRHDLVYADVELLRKVPTTDKDYSHYEASLTIYLQTSINVIKRLH